MSEVTGNIACADTTPWSNTACMSGVIAAPAGVATPPPRRATRLSQNIAGNVCRLNRPGALRGTCTPSGCLRAVPRPVAPVPAGSTRSSSPERDGWWQVMQEMS